MGEMRMFVKLVCMALACRGALGVCGAEDDDGLVAALGGASRRSVCADTARCSAEPWRRRWAPRRRAGVGVRGPPRDQVLRDRGLSTGNSLDERVTAEAPEFRANTVVARSVRPGAQGRLALLQLDRAYHEAHVLGNCSTAYRLLEEFAPWMDKVYGTYWMRSHLAMVKTQRSLLLSTPLITFCSTMLLPLGLFIGFFLLVTFCTGTPISNPYQNIDHYVPTSPWMEYKYSRGAVE